MKGNKKKTVIVKDIDKSPEMLCDAAKCIAGGGLVVFPTETVYGLGANALNPAAVGSIFTAKGRPSDNPLIVHIPDISAVSVLAVDLPGIFYVLANKFWPGPLTVVVKKSTVIPDEVTARLDTVALRIPEHPVALALLDKANVPIAAPSANISGKPSPTALIDAVEDMDGRADYILNGGKCRVGLESTVLDITHDTPVILRPGGITEEMLSEVLGEKIINSFECSSGLPRAPGMKYRHYSPEADMMLFSPETPGEIERIKTLIARDISEGRHPGVLCVTEIAGIFEQTGASVRLSGEKSDGYEIAGNIFAALREFDRLGCDKVYSQTYDNRGVGAAIMNRLNKAAGVD